MSDHQRPYLWVEFEKVGKLRHLSHLEVARVFDRAVRRAAIPVDYTEGYHPRAKISLAPPLPVGAKGLRELCEIALATHESAGELGKALSRQLPAGLNLISAQVLFRGHRSPFADLARAEYNATIDLVGPSGEQLAAAVEQFLGAEQVMVERQTKRQVRQIDVRPHVYELDLRWVDDTYHIYMNLGFGQENLVKPEEIIRVLARMMGQGQLRTRRLTRRGMYKV